MNTMLVGVTRPAESISTPLGSVSGPSCVGETPFPFGCANMVCGGTVIDTGGAVPGRPGVCGEQPASFGLYPVGTNTASCTPEPTPDLCGVYQCNGAGRCLPAQRPGLPPGGRTTECGFLPRDAPPETDCIHDGCVNGACVRDYADSSMCSRPGDAGCLNPWVCDGSRLYTFDDPDVLAAWNRMNNERSPEARQQAFADMQRLVLERAYAFPFGSLTKVQAVRSNVQGFVPFRIPRFSNVWIQR